MSKDDNYEMRQCKLMSDDSSLPKSSRKYTTTWIPSKFAVIHKRIELKNEKDIWESWVVELVYDPPLEYEYIRERAKDYKQTRKASDV